VGRAHLTISTHFEMIQNGKIWKWYFQNSKNFLTYHGGW
jgi:hypothetical protein